LNATEKLQAVKQCEVLAAADDASQEWLAEALEIEYFEAGQVVFEAGEHSTRVYVVVAGKLEARLGAQGELVSLFEPGALFGEYAMFTGGVRTAQVVAMTPCVVLSVDDEHFRTLLLRCPEVTVLLLQKAVRRLHRAERYRG
jgi:CRP-like cAMP-binding protein